MSYRSFKRVLGETSLERKCRFLFGGCMLLLITGSFWWYGRQTESLVFEQNPIKGRVLVDAILTMIHWQALETNEEFKPYVSKFNDNFHGRDYTWRLLRRGRTELEPRDEEEWHILEKFESLAASAADPAELEGVFDGRDNPKDSMYEHYQPVYARTFCVDCHRATVEGFPDLSEGDLIAVIKVSLPSGPTQQAINRNRAVLLATAIITVFLAMIAAYLIVRYVIVKPLKHLRDVSNEIRRGKTELRADIRTGDEFEELAVAFNRMLRHLVAVQAELRRLNADLDSKVDELAQLNMQLFEMNRIKTDFLATMSHELRTPLNGILGFSDVLSTSPNLEDRQKRFVQNIQNSGKMLLDMINDILSHAKLESGKMEVRLSDFRIEHVLGTLCDMARSLTEKKNIDLETDIETDLPKLRQDQAKLQQIVNNLLSNAIKFTPEGGRIVVTARRDTIGDLILQVADTGVGVAEEDRTRIFEKFRQGQSVTPAGDALTREYSGTGLGLSIVKELCRLLGGEISLESELGKGSIFTVRLPWTLSERPKLDSPLAETLEQLTRPRRLPLEPAALDPVGAEE
jgi:signal transduction histidine kinase